jgi:hypothetical protein
MMVGPILPDREVDEKGTEEHCVKNQFGAPIRNRLVFHTHRGTQGETKEWQIWNQNGGNFGSLEMGSAIVWP